MFNQSAEYALRAALYVANQPQGAACKATAVADALGVPANYLSKVMHMLVRAGVLTSVRGPTGGYSLARSPAELPLALVIAPFQDLQQNGRCLMGDRACTRSRPCAAHQRWDGIKQEIASFLNNTTLADMLNAASQVATRAQ